MAHDIIVMIIFIIFYDNTNMLYIESLGVSTSPDHEPQI